MPRQSTSTAELCSMLQLRMRAELESDAALPEALPS